MTLSLKGLVPFPTFEKIVTSTDASTNDIIKAVMLGEADVKKTVYTQKLAPYLRRSTPLATMRAVFDFVVTNIPYKADGLKQWAESPAYTLWVRKGIDCKSFAILTADFMRALGYRYEYVFISQNTDDSDPTHVFLAAYLPTGERVVLDSVYKKFNQEPPSTHRYIKKML